MVLASYFDKIRKSKAPLGVQLSALYWGTVTIWSVVVLALLLSSSTGLPAGSQFLIGFTNLGDLVALEGIKAYLVILVVLGTAFNLYTAYQLLSLHLRGFWYSVVGIALALVQAAFQFSQHLLPRSSFEWVVVGAQLAILVYLLGHKRLFK